uniref:PC-esterase domain-containing protein 1B-like n=1 Tax=Euleptes europaea TaxID=460621 RepID=UPI002540E962|nr:PC-esterase domain-containing protein 1B-like [Euleptes europaea]
MRRLLSHIYDFSSEEVQQLLHNKFVVILGDSIHRTIYKDLIHLLQNEEYLTLPELKEKGLAFDDDLHLQGLETFWNDHRVEGGVQHKKTNYREVRQYRTDHHLVRVYFITRAYSDYMESILEDFRTGPAPDLLILNSCVWDLNRYIDYSSNEPLKKAFREYRENLQTLFEKLRDILPPSCLVIWDTATPIAPTVTNAYLEDGMKNTSTPEDVLRANFDGATLACCYQFDVLDLNFYFRFLTHHLAPDGVHWDQLVHRCITRLLLMHVADAWGVELKDKPPQNGIPWNAAYQHHSPQYLPSPPRPPLLPPPPPRWRSPHPTSAIRLSLTPFNSSHNPNFQFDSFSDCENFSAYFNFEDVCEPPAHLEDHVPEGGWGPPLPSLVDYVPNGGPRGFRPLRRRSPRGFRGRHHNGRVMRRPRFYRGHFRPYAHPYNGAGAPPPYGAPPYQGWGGW